MQENETKSGITLSGLFTAITRLPDGLCPDGNARLYRAPDQSAVKVSIPITAMLVITIASCVLTYKAETKRRLADRIGVIMLQELITGDAMLRMVVEKNGDVSIRVNGNNENIHVFPGACSKYRKL